MAAVRCDSTRRLAIVAPPLGHADALLAPGSRAAAQGRRSPVPSLARVPASALVAAERALGAPGPVQALGQTLEPARALGPA